MVVEYNIGDQAGPRTRADIRFRMGAVGAGAVYCIDVAIVDPGAHSHVNAHSSYLTLDAAASYYEMVKIRQYNRRAMGENVVMVPFVVEATGRLGRAARGFMVADRVESVSIVQARMFYSHANALIAKWNARMLLDCRAHFGRGGAMLGVG